MTDSVLYHQVDINYSVCGVFECMFVYALCVWCNLNLDCEWGLTEEAIWLKQRPVENATKKATQKTFNVVAVEDVLNRRTR